MTRQYRQGDVLLCAIDSVPSSATSVPHWGNRVVLAEGELTGHAHSVSAKGLRLSRQGQSRRSFLVIRYSGAELRHEEHAPIPLPEGRYEVRRQRQYDPRASRRVRD